MDKNLAPKGYYASPKSDLNTEQLGNICRSCDWRPECAQLSTLDEVPDSSKCMSYDRADGVGVVFKRIKTVEVSK